jgi:hypothetical protein
MTSPYISVADDIRWLRERWWQSSDTLTGGDIRRGSACLRGLLVNGLVGLAWRQHGFSRQPIVYGPDAEQLAALEGLKLEHAASLIVGGGRLNGLDVCMIGAFRVFNPDTGKGPDENEGFAVRATAIIRDAGKSTTPGDLDRFVERPWDLSAYLDAPGAVRRGERIARREIIKYFAEFAGGAHLDRVIKAGTERATERNKFIAELEQRVHADTMDGLYFEVLSIGQTVGQSPDLRRLEAAISSGQAASREGKAQQQARGLFTRIDRARLDD